MGGYIGAGSTELYLLTSVHTYPVGGNKMVPVAAGFIPCYLKRVHLTILSSRAMYYSI